MVFLLVQSLKNVFFFLIFYVYRNTSLSVCHKCVWCPWRPEECVSDSQELDTACCELLCGCWEVDPGQLEKRSLFLTVEYLSSPSNFFLKKSGSISVCQCLEMWKKRRRRFNKNLYSQSILVTSDPCL